MFSSLRLPSLRSRAKRNSTAERSPTPSGPQAKRGSKCGVCPTTNNLHLGDNSAGVPPSDYIDDVTGEDRTKQPVINVDEKKVLDKDYPLPIYQPESMPSVVPRIVHISLKKEEGSLGLTLRGGVHPDPLLCRPLVITYVRPGGPAHREGTLRSGDRLIAVNGTSLNEATLTEAQELLNSSECAIITMTVEYDVNLLECVRSATGPLLVEIERPCDKDLGVTLAATSTGRIIIEGVITASIAERCGALHVGDQILAVDETRVEGSGLAISEVMELLQSSTVVTLEILPLSQAYYGRRRTNSNARYHGMLGPPSPSPSGYCSLSSQHLNRHNTCLHGGTLPGPHCRDYSDPPGVWHTETLGLTLHADKHGYGFTVHASPSSIYISDIRHDSPADRCGCLQVGDRLLTLNNKSLQSTESVTQLLSECEGAHITLTVEFNVADSVVPASGIFLVKLANRGNGLGITVTASKNRLPGESLQISEIRKGSVAHRTGTLKVGDHLLAIDNQRLDHCSLEDTQHILQSSSDIVTLRIQKQETATDTQSDSTVVYTVELEKYGGPIGITITGSEEMFEPITISGVTPGGLAEQTGAVHIGDQLLAINGESLQGKPLSEAINLLQDKEEHVMLRLSRTSKMCLSTNEGQVDEPRLTSVDSAVDSWDSNNTSPVNEELKSDIPHQKEYFSSSYHHPLSMIQYLRNSSLPPSSPAYCGDNTSLQHVDMYEYQLSHKVTLCKDPVYEDFGFSVSDGLYERGVYINRIRKRGPADLSNILKPYDRILQVNETRTNDFDCCLTVPLIASAGDKLELTVTRGVCIPTDEEMEDGDVVTWSDKKDLLFPGTITKTL